MKYWLDMPCSELSAMWLLDEHRSIHAYFGAMKKNFNKACRHILFGPYDPIIMFKRHEEQVRELDARGYVHKTPLNYVDAITLLGQRLDIGLEIGFMMRDGKRTLIPEALKLQDAYTLRTRTLGEEER